MIDEKSHRNVLIYHTSYETLIVSKPLRIRLGEFVGIITIYNGTSYLTLFGTKNMMLFTTELGIL